jgi:riboflavin-specific deaminase-like protein
MPRSVRPFVEEPKLSLTRLLPTGPPATIERIVEELGLSELAERAAAQQTSAAVTDDDVQQGKSHAQRAAVTLPRPYVLLNMISTLDGRASIGGRSGALGEEADKQLFHGLRTAVDAVMAGAGTIRAERYRRLVRDEPGRRIRRERGLAEEPLACVVSKRLQMPPNIPLLNEDGARVVVITPSTHTVADIGGQIDYIRTEHNGALDLRGALAQLRERFGVRTLLCEGGPHLNSQLLASGLVDELFLSLSPMLAGDDPTGAALRIVAGASLEPPVALELVAAFEHDSHLFLRYRVTRS